MLQRKRFSAINILRAHSCHVIRSTEMESLLNIPLNPQECAKVCKISIFIPRSRLLRNPRKSGSPTSKHKFSHDGVIHTFLMHQQRKGKRVYSQRFFHPLLLWLTVFSLSPSMRGNWVFGTHRNESETPSISVKYLSAGSLALQPLFGP